MQGRFHLSIELSPQNSIQSQQAGEEKSKKIINLIGILVREKYMNELQNHLNRFISDLVT